MDRLGSWVIGLAVIGAVLLGIVAIAEAVSCKP